MKFIRTIIQLAILAIAASAVWHFFQAYTTHTKLRDAAQYIAQNRGDKSDEQVRDEIVANAQANDIPLDTENVVVTHEGLATTVKVSYSWPLELVPTTKTNVPFSFTMSTYKVVVSRTPSK